MRRLLATLVVALALPASAEAVNYPVTNTDDAGAGSLRDAIEAANATAADDDITFTVTGTITLASALPIATDAGGALVVDGPGSDQLTIDANGDTAIWFQADASTVDGLTVTDAGGAGFFIDGANSVVIDDVVATDGNNMGVLVTGCDGVTITDSVASGNTLNGIYAENSSNVVVEDSRVGTDATGTLPQGNDAAGIRFRKVVESRIGGPGAGQANVIAANGGDGIFLTWDGATPSVLVDVRGNSIGTDPSGTVDLGNTGAGVRIGEGDGNNAHVLTDNTIAFNDGAGVQVGVTETEVSTNNTFSGNRFVANTGLPIAFGTAPDPIPNDAGDVDGGPNNGQNFPVLDAATPTEVTGQLDTVAMARDYTIELYEGTSCDQAERGRTPLVTQTVTTDAAGHADFTIPVAVAEGSAVSALATSVDDLDTSQMGSCVIALAPPSTYTVTNTNDSGAGSLRAAITTANGTAAADVIDFSATGTIALASDLPVATAAGGPLFIDGPGAAALEIDANGQDALVLQAAASAVASVTVDSGSGAGIIFDGATGTITGNVVRSSSGDGIRVLNSAGATVAGNTLGSNVRGILVIGSNDVDISGNRIGTDSGGLPQGNGTGILIDSTTGSTIGGATAADANVIAGNTETGVVITGASTGNEVVGNAIGTDQSGTTDPGEQDIGVLIGGAAGGNDGNRVADNTIAFNDVHGVQVGEDTTENSVSNTFTANRFYGNGGLPIAFGPVTDPTPNDALDADGGANRGQNFPVITAAEPTQVVGTLNSEASKSYDIELYEGTSCAQAERGRTPLATTTVTTDAAGDATFSVPVAVSEGTAVSALATETVDLDTSQMGSCVIAVAPPSTYTVTNTNDSGAGSLRAAITTANGTAAADVIDFSATGTIALASALPAATDAGGALVIDGPGSDQLTIDANGFVGIELQADASAVDDLTVTGAGDAGILIDDAGTVTVDDVVVTAGTVGVIVSNSTGVLITDSVLSGNTTRGIYAENSDNVDVQGNRIGTDPSGTSPQGNGGTGIFFTGVTASRIGGPDAADANVIADNGEDGIGLRGASELVDVRGNVIGTDSSATLDLGNNRDGVLIGGGGGANNAHTVRGNTIAFNDGDGIQAGVSSGENSSSNTFSGNSFFANGRLPIAFGPAASPTANDAGDADGGANRGQNFPVITAAAPAQVAGTLNSEASKSYDIELYEGTSCAQAERGRAPLATTTVTTDAAGDATFSVPVAVSEGTAVSALATSVDDLDTSQMGSCVIAVTPPGTYTVTNTNDSGAGSLRAAITTANASAAADVIDFDAGAVGTIALASALPAGSDAGGALVIDGPGSDQLTVDANGQTAIRLQADGSAVDDLAVTGAGDAGILVDSAENVAIDNVVVTGGANVGVMVLQGSGSSIDDSVISGNAERGIYADSSDNLDIRGNRIGTDPSGTLPQPNGTNGIEFRGVTESRIGGPGAGQANVIAANGGNGIALQDASVLVEVRGNSIGTDPGGTLDLGNGGRGVRIGPAAGNDFHTVAGNTVAFNDAGGVQVGTAADELSVGNTLTGNAFFANTGLPIAFGPATEPTENDADDVDAGPNHGQNFPVLGSATPSEVAGQLDTQASREYTIELYGGTSCDPAERGRTPLVTQNVTTDSDGLADFTIPVTVAEGTAVSALATSVDDLDTSQMGSCLLATTPATPTPTPTPSPSPSPEPSASPSPEPSASPSPEPSPSPGPPTPTPTASPAPSATPTPQAGETVVVAPVRGTVTVTLGGKPVPLGSLQAVPVGAVIDATKGRVALTAAKGTTTQTVVFYDGKFKVGQKKGITTAALQGKVGPCPSGPGRASAAKKKKKRKLWGDGSGSFETKGRYGSATVRGTKWLTEDTCKGTKVTVKEGTVAVKGLAGPSKGKTFTVPAGGTKLLKAPKQ